DPAIAELMAGLVERLPQGVHLALATRSDPRLPLSRLRARGQMTELRSADLRFGPDESYALLCQAAGRPVDPQVSRLLADRTEGWAVGLRLAALSLHDRRRDEAFARAFQGISSQINGYFADEVLAQQPAEVQAFALSTSILDGFCAPLCEAVTGLPAGRNREILESIAQANLFVAPLDGADGWYRYHPLFRDLLRHELGQQRSPAEVAGLHARAGAWFAQRGEVDQALDHLLAAGDAPAAVALVARERTDLLNRAQWTRLQQYLDRFSPQAVERSPELLALRMWLLYHRSMFAQLPAALQAVEAALARTACPPADIVGPQESEPLLGEVSAVRAIGSYRAADVERTLAHARDALAKVPRELWSVRLLARAYVAAARLMEGDVQGAYEAVYAGFRQEGDGSNSFKATLLTTACNVHWLTADLPGLARAAEQVLALSQDPHSPEFCAWGHYHLGRACYQRGDLAAAEEHFAAVAGQPYLSYGQCYVDSACGLAQARQALGRPEEARAAIEAAVALLLEMGNTTQLPIALACQAELALRQGQAAAAGPWAARQDPAPPLSPTYQFFSPHLTLIKVWLAQDTPGSRARALDLLDRARAFFESTHNSRFLIETLALQALLCDRGGDRPAALEALERSLALAEPGGFIRLFVDLGPPMARLLEELHRRGVHPDYISAILAAFPQETPDDERRTTNRWSSELSSVVLRPSSALFEPLTPRESEVLALLGQRLTNKEIAAELVISAETVKSHTLSIYRKLDVRGRRQAVARA
ncbi:MAG: LuxR C-terminal-related transcriptional regulator, partial [Anaerolineae bacterium]